MQDYIIHKTIKDAGLENDCNIHEIYCYYKFKAYLQETLRCTRKAYCCKKARYISMSASNSEIDHQTSFHYDEENRRESEHLSWAITLLGEKQRNVIILYYYFGKTELEISRIYHITRQAVNNLKRKGIERLKVLLDDKNAI